MSGESSGSTRPLSTEQRDDNDELEDAQLAASLDGCLEPRVNPIGVFVQFVWNEEVLLRVYQKRFSWTYRDFVVTDTNGMEVFQLVGRAKSTHMKTTMLDSKGDPILTISARLNTLTRQFIIRSGNSLRGGAEVARVKSNVMSIGLDVEVVFTNSLDENSLTLIVKGDGRKRNFVMTLGGVPVARVRRHWANKGTLAGGAATYYVRIAAGVDVALMSAIVACMEQRHPWIGPGT